MNQIAPPSLSGLSDLKNILDLIQDPAAASQTLSDLIQAATDFHAESLAVQEARSTNQATLDELRRSDYNLSVREAECARKEAENTAKKGQIDGEAFALENAKAEFELDKMAFEKEKRAMKAEHENAMQQMVKAKADSDAEKEIAEIKKAEYESKIEKLRSLAG